MGNSNYSTHLVKNLVTGDLETICLDTGEVLKAVSIHELDKYRFNFDMALLICQKIREGATLKQIGDDPTLPSLTVIHYWRRTNATFDEEIKLARKDRAEYYADKVIEIANEVVDKDDVPVAKFKADQYKWAAEKGDPSSYGNKIEHTGSNVAPSIVVVTGISRLPDVEVISNGTEDVSDFKQPEQISEGERERVQEADQAEGATIAEGGGASLPPTGE